MNFRKVLLLAGTIASLIGFSQLRASGDRRTQTNIESAPLVAIRDGAAARLAGAIRIPTVSHDEASGFDSEAFQSLHTYLQLAFPRVHCRLRRESVETHSLLYTWKGSDPTLKPVLLMGHMDVVPVEPGTEGTWKHEPFSGTIADGYIWGRGAIDNKSGVLGTLEAVEMLLLEGFRPARTIYLAYGHDEEVGGTRGANEIAALLRRRGVQLEMVLDEGGVIADGVLSGISSPIALVGIAEKGFVSVELSASAPGGHSSLPPRQTAIGIVANAVTRLEKNSMTARLDGATRQMFDRLASYFPFGQRLAFTNLWLTRPLVLAKLEASPTTNAMVRTTTAATVFHSGTKDNVLPTTARAIINSRILPNDSVAGVLEHVRRVVDDDRIELRVVGRFSAEPSALSSTDSASFRILDQTIRGIAPDAIVAPYLVVVVTDARYFSGLSDNIFRFLPLRLGAADLKRMHGTDERIAVGNYENAIRLYRQLVINAASE
jgi:carboxypeptidase PM20D1